MKMKSNNRLNRNSRVMRGIAFAVLAVTLLAAAYLVYLSGHAANKASAGDLHSQEQDPPNDLVTSQLPTTSTATSTGNAAEGDDSLTGDAAAPGQATLPAGAIAPSHAPGSRPDDAPAAAAAGQETQLTTAPHVRQADDLAASLPRHQQTCQRLLARVEAIQAAMHDARFYVGVYEVDAANPTLMLVLAETKAHADQLDGFFRLMIDLDGETWGHAPLAIGLGRLYTQSGRDRAYASGTFCADGLDGLLAAALQAALAEQYDPGMLAFILEEYRAGMEARWQGGDGSSRAAYRAVAPFPAMDVVFNDGFVTYVEFFPDPLPAKP